MEAYASSCDIDSNATDWQELMNSYERTDLVPEHGAKGEVDLATL